MNSVLEKTNHKLKSEKDVIFYFSTFTNYQHDYLNEKHKIFSSFNKNYHIIQVLCSKCNVKKELKL